MTGSDRTNEGAEPVDPWAPGGAMASVPPPSEPRAPLSFGPVDTPSRDRDRARSEASIAASAAAADPTVRRPARWRGGGSLVALAAVLAVVAVAVIALSGGDESATAPSVPEAEPTPLPSEPVDNVPPPTAPRSTPPPLLADSAAPQRVDPDTAPRQFVVDVVADLSSIDPIEIVAFADGDDGTDEIYEVSLPSGRTRVTALGVDLGRAQLAVNDEGALVWPAGDGAVAIGSEGTVTFVTGRIDAVSWAPAAAALYLWGSATGSTDADVRRLDFDGRSVALERAVWLDANEEPAALVDFDGALLRPDAGGTYRVTSTATTRLTSGDVVSSGTDHLLLRECDEQRRCSLVSLDRAGGRTAWPVDLPVGFTAQQFGGLSPRGDALLVFSPRAAADGRAACGASNSPTGPSGRCGRRRHAKSSLPGTQQVTPCSSPTRCCSTSTG